MTRLSRVLGFRDALSTHPVRHAQVATSATSCLRTARDQSGSSRKCGGDRYFKPVPENYKYHPSAATIRVSPKSRGTPNCSPVTLVDSGGARARSEKKKIVTGARGAWLPPYLKTPQKQHTYGPTCDAIHM